MNASDVLIESLLDWGVDVIVGLPGDGITGIITARPCRQNCTEDPALMRRCGGRFSAYAKIGETAGTCGFPSSRRYLEQQLRRTFSWRNRWRAASPIGIAKHILGKFEN